MAWLETLYKYLSELHGDNIKDMFFNNDQYLNHSSSKLYTSIMHKSISKRDLCVVVEKIQIILLI